MLHTLRIAESSPAGHATPSSSPKRRRLSPVPRPTPPPARADEEVMLRSPFSQLVGSIGESGGTAATPAAAVALPIPLLPFHRAFQEDGWRIAVNTPEDRWSGRHVVTSLFALLWLKSPTHVLNYSSDRQWVAKVRHMVQTRNAAALAGPNVRGDRLPEFSPEAEFCLAHALHLPHTIIYTEDRSTTKEHAERMRLSDFPRHVWQMQRTSANGQVPAGESTDGASSFTDCDIQPSVWYFSRHAFQGQHEILRKNKPASKREHLDALRKVFLREAKVPPPQTLTNAPATAAVERRQRPTSATGLAVKSSPTKSRPGTAVGARVAPTPAPAAVDVLAHRIVSITKPPPPPPSDAAAHAAEAAKQRWAEATAADVTRDTRVTRPGQGDDHVDIVAQYTSLDKDRGTHIAYLQRRDLEHFIQQAAARGTDGAHGPSSAARPSSGTRARPTTAHLTDAQRRARVRQDLYADLYNEMDLMPATGDLPFDATIAAVGTKPRPATSRGGFDPLALHPSKPPTHVSVFERRRIVGMLQQFVPPPGEHAEVLRVEWKEELVPAYATKAEELRATQAQLNEWKLKFAARIARRAKRDILTGERHDSDSDSRGGGAIAEGESDEEEDAHDEEEAEERLDQLQAKVVRLQEQLSGLDERRTICYISRRLNAHPLRSPVSLGVGERDRTLYDRVCCFGYADGSPPVLDSAVMNGVLYTRLSYVCDIVSAHIGSISRGNLRPCDMALFFQVDRQHDLHLLWADRLVYWHEKAMLEGPAPPLIPGEAEERELARLVQKQRAREERRREKKEKKKKTFALRVSPPLPSEAERIDWTTFDFVHFPAPSPMSALMSEALQGRYHKLVGDQTAALNLQSLKDDVQSSEDEADEAAKKSPADDGATLRRPDVGVAAAPRRSSSWADSSSDEEDEPEQQLGTTGEFTVHVDLAGAGGAREGAMEALREEEDEEAAAAREEDRSLPTLRVTVADGPSIVVVQKVGGGGGGDEDDSSSDDELPSADEHTTSSDQLVALLASSKQVASKSEWADEILFEFARKRQLERNHFRRQEASFEEDQAAKRTAIFSPTNAQAPTTPSIQGLRGRADPPSKGVNLLNAAASAVLAASFLGSPQHGQGQGHRREMASPAAFLLAKQQKLYGSGLAASALPGQRGLRGQLAHGLDLPQADKKSGWESRSVASARRERLLAEGGTMGINAGGGLHSQHGYKRRQIDAMVHRVPSQHPNQQRLQTRGMMVGTGGSDDAFQAKVIDQYDNPDGHTQQALQSSASATALGASISSSNLLPRSGSTTSFAPRAPRARDEDAKEEEETTDDVDHTFLTSTGAPSPRALMAQARIPRPLVSTQITIGGTVQSAQAMPADYFTCPKCRLNLQIHSVHATMIVDVLGEYGRMVQFMRDHQREFQDELEWAKKKKSHKHKQPASNGAGKTPSRLATPKSGARPSASQLSEYLDLSYLSESAMPPTIAFVFPHLTYAEYAVLREDADFLRSTIDLCEDCHLLVRVPLRADGEEAEEIAANPDLADPHEDFHNPSTEALRKGQGHSSIMARQASRRMDQEVEERSFHTEVAIREQARRDRPPGEVDPLSAAAGLIPLDIRRLNQSTVELLATIPFNDLEVAEYDRKQAEAEAAADPTGKGRRAETAAKIQAVMERYEHAAVASAHQARVHGHVTASTPMTFARRVVQTTLLESAGVFPHDTGGQTRAHIQPMPARAPSGFAHTPNPFMGQRSSTTKLDRVESTTSLRRLENARRTDQIKRDEEAAEAKKQKNKEEQSSQQLARTLSSGGLLQQQRARSQMDATIAHLVAESRSASHLAPGDAQLGAKFAHRSVTATGFAPLYEQLVAPKRLARPVDHVALAMATKQSAVRGFSPLTKYASPDRRAQSASSTRSNPLVQVHKADVSLLSSPSTRSALQDVPTPYSVVNPSAYAPNLISITRGPPVPFPPPKALIM